MVVDDDNAIRELVTAIMSGIGHDIIQANNGQEALDIFNEKNKIINLIIMDITMPIMNGINAAIAMREVNPDAKIILTSGYSDNAAEVANPNAFLAKPFDSKALCEIVRQVLEVA
jgi:two-component system cell cycle sensor histidine kinase/response regulator CckA